MNNMDNTWDSNLDRTISTENGTRSTDKRVGFDDQQSDTQCGLNETNYEDVLTLRVPSKENIWLSCRQNKRSWNIFKRKREQTRKGKKYKKQTHHVNGKQVNLLLTESNYSSSEQSSSTGLDNHRNTDSSAYESQRKEDVVDEEDPMVWTTNLLAALSILIIVMTFPFSLFYCIRIVAEYERAVVLRMGSLIPKGKGTKGPGLFFILPCIDSVRKVDLRTITFAIPPQELLTRDSVTVSVDAVVYYRVLNPVASVLNIEDATRSTRLLAQTTIRNVLGTKDLAQILTERNGISSSMQTNLDATTDAWGVKVERVEIKDVRLPIQLQRAMAAEAEAARAARAKVIAAIGEQQAARSLKKAARVISTSPMAFQLRYLQTLSAISTEKNSTIFFPVPIDIMQNLNEFASLGKFTDVSAVLSQDAESLRFSQDQLNGKWAYEMADTNSDTV